MRCGEQNCPRRGVGSARQPAAKVAGGQSAAMRRGSAAASSRSSACVLRLASRRVQGADWVTSDGRCQKARAHLGTQAENGVLAMTQPVTRISTSTDRRPVSPDSTTDVNCSAGALTTVLSAGVGAWPMFRLTSARRGPRPECVPRVARETPRTKLTAVDQCNRSVDQRLQYVTRSRAARSAQREWTRTPRPLLRLA